MQKLMKLMYEGTMILLVLLTIMTIWTEHTINSTINWIVWGIFFIDFLVRLWLTKNKWDFVKQNPFLILAIIPFDQFFQIARIVRLIYFFRIKTIAKYYITPYVKKLTYQSLTAIGISFFIFVLLVTIIVWKVEENVITFWESIYVVFSYLFFLGHRIFLIEHTISIFFLTITSVLGVVLQGLALQWAFTKAETVYQNYKDKQKRTRAS